MEIFDLAAVTGATGLIGRQLVNLLLTEGFSVRALTRRPDQARDLWDDQIEIFKGDLTDPQSIRGFTEGVAVVYHLAGSISEPEMFTPVNELGTKNLLHECMDQPIKRFVHLSSVGVIGTTQEKIVDEKTSCQPQNDYERSKLQGEQLVLQFFREQSLPVTIMRPTIVFGPGRDKESDSFASWMQAIKSGRYRYIGNGQYVANYIFARDVAAACIYVTQFEEAVGEIYIVSDPSPLREFVQAAADLMDAPAPPTIPLWIAKGFAGLSAVLGNLLHISLPLTPARLKALTNETTYSTQKIRQTLRFEPPTGYKKGLVETIRWYRQQATL